MNFSEMYHLYVFFDEFSRASHGLVTSDGNNTWRMAKAILRAFHFCVDTGFHSFILECSSAGVVSLLQGDSKCYTELDL
jgi:hypothetical protein